MNNLPTPIPHPHDAPHHEVHEPRVSLVPRLGSRLATLLGRLHLTALPQAEIDLVSAALEAVLARIAAAEHGVHGRDWALALRAAQSCRPLLTNLAALARQTPAPADGQIEPRRAVASLWNWLVTQAELYCTVHLAHLGLVLDEQGDIPGDYNSQIHDFTGHVGERLLRQIAVAEAEAVHNWPSDRYLLYRQLHTSFGRLRDYTAARDWAEESDALSYMMRRVRMHGLHYYVWARPAHTTHGHNRGRRDRVGALGRLLLDRFYWLVAGFGYRPLRALGVNTVIILVCALLYWQFNLLCVFYTNGGTQPAQSCQPVGFVQALYFSSLAFLLADMGEILPRPLWGQVLLVLQSIWGFLNVSVLIAVIVNRQSSSG